MLERRLNILAVAAVFTTLFMLIGWRSINPYAFTDLENYRLGFDSDWFLFLTLNRSPLDFFLSEGVWVRLFEFLNEEIGDMDTTFTVISVVSLFLISTYVITATRSLWCLLFFLNPAFVNLVIEQIRSGLAAGLFWVAVIVKNRFLKVALMLFAASIHTAFFLFGAIYLAYYALRQFPVGRSMLTKPGPVALALVVMALLLSLFRDVALAAIGDQRAYQFLEYTSGIYLALAWATFIPTYLMARKERELSFEAALYVFSTSMAFFSAVSGVYGSRFAAVAIPALAILSTRIEPQYRLAFAIQYAGFSAIYFYFWVP